MKRLKNFLPLCCALIGAAVIVPAQGTTIVDFGNDSGKTNAGGGGGGFGAGSGSVITYGPDYLKYSTTRPEGVTFNAGGKRVFGVNVPAGTFNGSDVINIRATVDPSDDTQTDGDLLDFFNLNISLENGSNGHSSQFSLVDANVQSDPGVPEDGTYQVVATQSANDGGDFDPATDDVTRILFKYQNAFNPEDGEGDQPFTFRVDEITATAVPEPASLAVLGLGGLVLMTRRRRRD